MLKEDNVVYELKYVSQLSHENFLQCACYIIALGLKKGILWNTKDNSMFEITIPNVEDFLNATVRAITKNQIKEYIRPNIESPANNTTSNNSICELTNITIDDKEVALNDKVFHINRGEGIIKKIYFSGNCLLIVVQHMSNPQETNTYDLKTSLKMGFIKI